MVTVPEVMRELNNYFESGIPAAANYHISADGTITPSDGLTGAYIAISGSNLHDGVFPMSGNAVDFGEDIAEETFEGVVYDLHPPKAFIDLCAQIAAFDEKTPVSAYTSESFGGYSYTRNAAADTWQKAFKSRLNVYRRMFTEVNV